MDDNDNQPMDSGERAEAALAAFSGDDKAETTANTAASAANDGQQAAQGQDANDPAAVREQTQEQAAAALTEEQLQADPRYTELTSFRDETQGVFDKYGIPDHKELDLQLADSSVLYQIAQGQASAARLMDTFLQVWPKEAVDRTAGQLIEWLNAKGYLKGGAQAAAKQGEAGFKDPLAERIGGVEKTLKEQKEAAEAERVQAHRTEVFNTKFLPQVNKLCEQKRIPKEDSQEYASRIASSINGNPAILKRIEAGNLVDVQRIFTELYNAEVARLQRWTKSQTAAAQKKANDNPRIPSGGAPPAPANSAARTRPRTRDERIAEAEAQF